MKLFGTDGIRGIVGEDLTADLAYRVGQVVGSRFSQAGAFAIIGRDTRLSGDMLTAALMAGLMEVGMDVLDAGIIPTPGVAHLIREKGAALGIVISASHNPYVYNGIKIFTSDGVKLPDAVEEEIEAELFASSQQRQRAQDDHIGRLLQGGNPREEYMLHLKNICPNNLTGMKIAIDTGNGALFDIAGPLLRDLGAEVIEVSNDPDGRNINDNCGSTNPSQVQSLLAENHCDCAFSFDGDADRIIAVDDEGHIMDGDHILAICATQMKEEGALVGASVVGTIMTNMGLDDYLKGLGVATIKTKVGDRYIIEEMEKNGYVLGGEQSGHIILRNYNSTGDGLATALYLLHVMKERGAKMSELNGLMTSYPQVLLNASVPKERREEYKNNSRIQEEIQKVERDFSGKGRVIIRPSGTEPLVRVMIEGQDQEKLEAEAKRLAQIIEEEMKA